MKPLIKWPGGKSDELTRIGKLAPENYRTYIEPFVGGGAHYFQLEPKKAIINDINAPLMELYRHLRDDHKGFVPVLKDLVTARTAIETLFNKIDEPLYQIFLRFCAKPDVEKLEKEVTTVLRSPQSALSRRYRALALIDPARLQIAYIRSVVDKMRRLQKKIDGGAVWSEEDIRSQILTALHAGLYMYMRDYARPANTRESVAQFYYIREFCYGAMFRYNKMGKFNIPYGGHSYNSKDLGAKFDYITSQDVHALLARTKIYNMDFPKMLGKMKLHPDDYIFLDPPYDSDFTDYAGHAFGQTEHAALAKWFSQIPCQALLIIGKSPYTEKLYKDIQKTSQRKIVMENYNVEYAYNVKGRNARAATHYAIRNY